MGKITGLIYSSIYLIVCGAVLAVAAGSATVAYALLGLAGAVLVALCVVGERLDSLCKDDAVRGSASSVEAPRERLIAERRRGEVRVAISSSAKLRNHFRS